MEGATRLVVTSRQKPAAFVINMFCLNLARTWVFSAWLSDIQTFITCLLNFNVFLSWLKTRNLSPGYVSSQLLIGWASYLLVRFWFFVSPSRFRQGEPPENVEDILLAVDCATWLAEAEQIRPRSRRIREEPMLLEECFSRHVSASIV